MTARIQQILSDIERLGYSINEGLFRQEELCALELDISEVTFKKAGIGKHAKLEQEVRSDSVFWLDPSSLTSSQKIIFKFFEGLKQALNQKFFWV